MPLSNAEKQARWRERHIGKRRDAQRVASFPYPSAGDLGPIQAPFAPPTRPPGRQGGFLQPHRTPREVIRPLGATVAPAPNAPRGALQISNWGDRLGKNTHFLAPRQSTRIRGAGDCEKAT
jgi:hypothetical protein